MLLGGAECHHHGVAAVLQLGLDLRPGQLVELQRRHCADPIRGPSGPLVSRDDILRANDATYAAWNAHDPVAVAAIFAPDAQLVDAGNPEPVSGRDAIRKRAVELLGAFENWSSSSGSTS